MTTRNIISTRLFNQGLSRPDFQTPEEVVEWFGAVQAQDYYGTVWSLGQRVVSSTQQTIEKAFNDGKILLKSFCRWVTG